MTELYLLINSVALEVPGFINIQTCGFWAWLLSKAKDNSRADIEKVHPGAFGP